MASCGDNFPIVRIASFFITGICLASSCSSSIPNTLLWGIWGTLSISYISIVLLLPAQQFYRWQSYAGLIGLTTLLWAGFVCRMQDQNLVDADLATHIPHIEAYVAVALEPLPSDSTKKALTVGVQQFKHATRWLYVWKMRGSTTYSARWQTQRDATSCAARSSAQCQ